MRASIAADHPFVRKRRPVRRGPRLLRGPQAAVQGRDPRRPGRPLARSPAQPLPPTSTYEHGPFIDLCKGPHVASTGKIGPFKLMTVAGAYWRGSEKRPMLQRIYGTVWPTQAELDAVPPAPRGGQAARPSPPRRPARPVQLPRRQPRLGLLASQGPASLAHARDRHPRGPGPARLPGSLHADARPQEAVGAVGPLGQLPGQHVRRRVRGPDLQPQADELPREHVHLQEPAALVPRSAAALLRVRPAAPQRAVRDAVRPDAGPPLRPGRRPHLRPPRSAPGRDQGAARRGRTRSTAGSASSRSSRSGPSRTRRSAIRRCGRRPKPRSRPPSTRSASRTGSSRRTAPSTRRRSTSRSRTRWAASGRRPRSRWTW